MKSIERFRATRQTLQRSRPYTLKQYVMILGVSWLTPMAVAACYAYSKYDVYTILFCHTYEFYIGVQDWFTKSVLALFDFITVILCCVIFILSIVTIRRLSRTQAIHANISEDQRKIRMQRSRAAVRMVLGSVLLYILCWCPNFLFKAFSSAFTFHVTDDNWAVTFPYAYRTNPSCDNFIIIFPLTFLPIVNSCFSPFIYIIFLRDFREAAKKVLCRKETVSQSQRSSHELQPMPKPVEGSSRMQNCDEAAIINMSKATKEKKSKIKELSGSSTNAYS
ncbi:Somatostatin receptor type 5 [Exaiptasia diaphana]|nr:Somatostatin receptor type 5 [Exaiptasia diaphana]